MADIAAIFHWPPAAMNEFSLSELVEWQRKAVDRAKLLKG
jgi:hypothetical protein